MSRHYPLKRALHSGLAIVHATVHYCWDSGRKAERAAVVWVLSNLISSQSLNWIQFYWNSCELSGLQVESRSLSSVKDTTRRSRGIFAKPTPSRINPPHLVYDATTTGLHRFGFAFKYHASALKFEKLLGECGTDSANYIYLRFRVRQHARARQSLAQSTLDTHPYMYWMHISPYHARPGDKPESLVWLYVWISKTGGDDDSSQQQQLPPKAVTDVVFAEHTKEKLKLYIISAWLKYLSGRRRVSRLHSGPESPSPSASSMAAATTAKEIGARACGWTHFRMLIWLLRVAYLVHSSRWRVWECASRMREASHSSDTTALHIDENICWLIAHQITVGPVTSGIARGCWWWWWRWGWAGGKARRVNGVDGRCDTVNRHASRSRNRVSKSDIQFIHKPNWVGQTNDIEIVGNEPYCGI